MEHSAYVKTLGVFSLLQIVMLSLILQMLKNGQVYFSPPFTFFVFDKIISHFYEDNWICFIT